MFMNQPGDGDMPRLELTYNFGVDSYEIGTGYGHIAITAEDLDGDARAARRAGHRAREAALLGARGRLAAVLRAGPGRLPDRDHRAVVARGSHPRLTDGPKSLESSTVALPRTRAEGGTMSEQNVEFVKSVSTARSRAAICLTVLAAFADDVEWFEAEGMPYGGLYRSGEDGTAERLRPDRSRRGGLRGDALRSTSRSGATVAAIVATRAPGKATGKTLDEPAVHVWEIRDGKLSRFRQFIDTVKFAEVVRAGLDGCVGRVAGGTCDERSNRDGLESWRRDRCDDVAMSASRDTRGFVEGYRRGRGRTGISTASSSCSARMSSMWSTRSTKRSSVVSRWNATSARSREEQGTASVRMGEPIVEERSCDGGVLGCDV